MGDNTDPIVEIMKNIVKYKFKFDRDISDDCKDLISSKLKILIVELLTPKFDSRIGVRDIFTHKWTKSFEIKNTLENIDPNMRKPIFINDMAESTISTNNVTLPTNAPQNGKLFDQVLTKIEKGDRKKKAHNLMHDMDILNRSIEKEGKNAKIVLKIEPTPINPIGISRISTINPHNDENMSILRDIQEMSMEIDKTAKKINKLHTKTSKNKVNRDKDTSNILSHSKLGDFDQNDFYDVNLNGTLMLENEIKKTDSSDKVMRYAGEMVDHIQPTKKKSRNMSRQISGSNKKFNYDPDKFLTSRNKNEKYKYMNGDDDTFDFKITREKTDLNRSADLYRKDDDEKLEAKSGTFWSNFVGMFKCA